MASLQGRVVLRLANADVPPLDYVNEADYWRMAYRQLETTAANREQEVPHLREARELIAQWDSEARSLEAELTTALASGFDATDVARLYYRAARDFLRPAAVSYFAARNLFRADPQDEDVSGSTLPGIRFAMDHGDLGKANQEAEIYLAALRQRVASLAALRGALK
jgi:hypothetical protein